MKKLALIVMTSLLIGCANLPTQTPKANSWRPATILGSHEQIVHSTFTQKDYLIQVATIGERPKDGYAVVYVLDGNAFFAPSASIAQTLHGRPSETEPKSLLVVGIGYNTARQFDIPKRTHDYTPPSASYPTPKGEQVAFGGAEAFYQFITQELNPVLDDKFGINARHRTLMGHSYGGLFGLYTLFKHSQSFDNYLIASPSIWWNDKSVYQYQAHFSPTPNVANVIVTLGEHELNARHRNPDAPTTDLEGSEAYQTMQFLKQHLPNAKVDFHFNLGQSHGMNAYPSIIQGMTMAYDECKADKDC